MLVRAACIPHDQQMKTLKAQLTAANKSKKNRAFGR